MRHETAAPADDLFPGARIAQEWEMETLDTGCAIESGARGSSEIKSGAKAPERIGREDFDAAIGVTEDDLVDIANSFRIWLNSYGPRIFGKKPIDERFEVCDLFVRSLKAKPRIIERV